jgi:hypothetical protein
VVAEVRQGSAVGKLGDALEEEIRESFPAIQSALCA